MPLWRPGAIREVPPKKRVGVMVMEVMEMEVMETEVEVMEIKVMERPRSPHVSFINTFYSLVTV